MSVLKFLRQLLKVLLPFLMTAAEKAFKKLPKEKQEQLIKISKMVEIIKQMKGTNVDDVFKAIEKITGMGAMQIEDALIAYAIGNGIYKSGTWDIITEIWNEADKRTETGLKSLWSGISNIVSATVAEIDWELLLMGVGEFVYRSFVKDKIKV